MTLAALKTFLQDWTSTTETLFVANLDLIIQKAEQSIYKKVKVPSGRLTTNISTTNGVNTVSAPTGMGLILNLFAVVSSESYPLIQRDPSFIREAYATVPVGVPLDYAWLRSATASSTILLGPTPNGTITLTLEYYGTLSESLVTVTTGTWLSINFPDTLQKHALYQAAIFLKMTEMMETYKTEAQESLKEIGEFVIAGKSDEWKS